MSRAHLYRPILTTAGDLVAPINVRVLNPGTSTLLTEPDGSATVVYSGATGSSAYQNGPPSYITFNDGVVDFYLAQPRRVRLGITPAGQNEFFLDDVDVVTDSLLFAPQPMQVTNIPTAVGQVLAAQSTTRAQWQSPGEVRATATYTTAALSAGQNEQGLVTLAKSYRVMSLRTSAPARVRLYTRAAARTADVSRPANTDPADGAGVVLDFVTTDDVGTAAAADLSPQALGSSMENIPSAGIPISVTPIDAGTVTVTFNYTVVEQ